MRIILTVTLFLFFNQAFSQEESGIQPHISNYLKVDKIADYDDSIIESFELFQDSNKTWRAKHLKFEEDSLISIKNVIIDTTNRFDEKLWLKILMTDVHYLPAWEKLDYKLKYNKSIIELNDNLVIFWDRKTILHGDRYVIEIKTDYDKGNSNKIRYPAPQYFLPELEDVDEIQSVSELLQILDEHFKAFIP